MSRRLKLIVAYDGRPFAGWQSQANRNAVQDHLEKSFARVIGTKVRVHGAGRTDAGVHALAQCAHADVPETKMLSDQWVAALNSNLPPMIRVLRCAIVTSDFHARFSAKGKAYRYRIWNARILPPLELGRFWHVAVPLDLPLIKKEAQSLVGRHDFAAFAANRGQPKEDTTRTIREINIRRTGPRLSLEVSGDGFLYKMVRLMIGTLVEIGRGKLPPASIEERLKQAKKHEKFSRVVAPAEGLYLIGVRY